MAAADIRQLLEAGDVEGLRCAWHALAPGMPQPESREQAEIAMHHARTQAHSVTFKARAYSHCWLQERSLPSGLPDQLRPKAERMYPAIAAAVGISVNFRSDYMRPAAAEVRTAMEAAVLEAEADKRLEDAEHVRARMMEAKDKTLHALFGS